MLDLDTLAERRAKSLDQVAEAWRAAIWSAEFQKLSTFMSDGEVEQLISFCPSVAHLQAVVKHLNSECASSGLSPFQVLIKNSESEGLNPGEWIARKMESV